MPLTKQQQEKAQKWLESKVTNMACPKCGQGKWNIWDIVTGSIVSKDGVSMGGDTYPVVLVACANCAHVEQYGAVMMGLLE